MVPRPLGRAVGWHGADVAAEEARVVHPGLAGECLDPGSGGQRGARLVESDMAVCADPQDLRVHAPAAWIASLVGRTCGRNVGGQTVGSLHGAGGEVDARDEHGVDDRAVALRMVGGRPAYSSRVNPLARLERDPAGRATGREFVVDRQRRRSGGQTQHRVWLSGQQRLDRVRPDPADLGRVLEDDYFHAVSIRTTYLFDAKKECATGDFGTGVDSVSDDDVEASCSSITTTGTIGLKPAAMMAGTS